MREDGLRSIRSFSRARTKRERGYALVWAIGLALLFFMLIQLVLIDSARELAEARRFRGRILAATLAENGAELAATRMTDRPFANVDAEDWQGKITGRMQRQEAQDDRGKPIYKFQIRGDGDAKGTDRASARVEVFGRIEDGQVHIDYTLHTP
jgi:hypothetical protein